MTNRNVDIPPVAEAIGDWGRGQWADTPQYRRMGSFCGQTRRGATDGCHEPIEVCICGDQAADGEIDAAIAVGDLLVDTFNARVLAADLAGSRRRDRLVGYAMNDRKRAWQILHTEIRRRGSDDDETDWQAWETNIGTIMREADSLQSVILELAGFGATFALMGRDGQGSVFLFTGEALERQLKVADSIGATIMQEPDYPDDE